MILQNCLHNQIRFKRWVCSIVRFITETDNQCENEILSGNCWLCLQCNQYHLCDACLALSIHSHSFIKIDATTGYTENPENDLFLLSMVVMESPPTKRKMKKREIEELERKRECILQLSCLLISNSFVPIQYCNEAVLDVCFSLFTTSFSNLSSSLDMCERMSFSL